MAYHNDLLVQADRLLNAPDRESTQADRRRAVSAAYYALFHLLISETTRNWNHDNSRADLGRMFDHNQMRKASQRLLTSPGKGAIDPQLDERLKILARAFVQLQEKRHIADYDNGTEWSYTEAVQQVQTAMEAFGVWNLIQGEDAAQKYLVSLLIKLRD